MKVDKALREQAGHESGIAVGREASLREAAEKVKTIEPTLPVYKAEGEENQAHAYKVGFYDALRDVLAALRAPGTERVATSERSSD